MSDGRTAGRCRTANLSDVEAEEERQRVRRDVVRSLRRTVRILAQVGVALPLEQRLGEAAERLLGEYDVATRGIAHATHVDRGRRLAHLDLAALQRVEQSLKCRPVRLCLRDNEGRRPGVTPP